MTDTPDVPQLLANTQAVADNTTADAPQIEAITVETVSAFEARLQHHFARGPFFVKLRSKLAAQGDADLAERVHHTYLAANVLKHGGGKSLRELTSLPNQPFTLQDIDGKARIDVTTDGFLNGVITALREAHQFLTSK